MFYEPGDRVFVVTLNCKGRVIRTGYRVVSRVTRKYGQLSDGESFCLDSGICYPASFDNFRVYSSKEIYLQAKVAHGVK